MLDFAFNIDSLGPSEGLPHTDKPLRDKRILIMAPKNVIIGLPAEIVENIAACLQPKDPLSLRCAHPQLAELSHDAFAAEYLTQLVLSMQHQTIDSKIRGLLKLKRLAPRVLKLRIEINQCQCGRRCKVNKKRVITKMKIGGCVAALTSLRELSYGRGSKEDPVLFQLQRDGQIIKLSNLAPLRVIDFSPNSNWGDMDVIVEP